MEPSTTRANGDASPTPAAGAYALVRVGHVLLVRLGRAPTPTALAALAAEVAQAHEAVGDRLVYIAVVPRDAQAPGPEIRPLLAEFARYVSRACAEVHLVIQVEGFAGTVLRSAITAVAMVSRERNLVVHGALSGALDAAQHSGGATELESAARSLGLLH